MADLRSVIGVLRDGSDGSGPRGGVHTPVAGLDDLDDLLRRSGLTVTVDEIGRRGDVPAPVGRTVYRIVQEALTNSVRHGGATRADLTLRYGPRHVTVQVCDNGSAPPAAAPDGAGTTGHGLAGMRLRAAALGGALTAGPAPDGGFTVRATIPVEV